jgi:uncharacterized membrane protein YfcA
VDLPLEVWLLVLAVTAIGAIVQAAVGFGSAMVVAPVVALIDPRLVPGPVLVSGLFLTCLVAVRERAGIDVRAIGWILVGRLPGSVLAAVLLVSLPAAAVSHLFAALVLLAVGLTASGLRIRPTPATLASAGLAGGLMGTITSIGGPPVALVLQHSAGLELRGTLAGNFLISSLISLTVLSLSGLFDTELARLSLGLLPGTALGFALSQPARRWLDRGYTRPAVLLLSASMALAVIVKAW